MIRCPRMAVCWSRSRGRVDASLGTQLAAIRNAVTDAVRMVGMQEGPA